MDTYSLITNTRDGKKFTNFDRLLAAEDMGCLQLQIDLRYDEDTDIKYGEFGIFKDLEGRIVSMLYNRAGYHIPHSQDIELRYGIYSVGIPQLIRR